MTAIRLDKLLKSGNSNGLQNIVENAQMMQTLTDALQRALPAGLAGELCAANMRDDGELVIVASTSAWAAKLRFEEQRLLETARTAGAQATRLRVTVSRNC